MSVNYLGKITSAEFGFDRDRDYLMGLHLRFQFDGSSVGSGSKYTENVSSSCKWESNDKRNMMITCLVDNIYKILKDAKVTKVSELVNKPVLLTIEGGIFKDFRILTEVL